LRSDRRRWFGGRWRAGRSDAIAVVDADPASKHVSAILAKLDVASRAETAVLAVQRSLV
jgi:hypothetical protein